MADVAAVHLGDETVVRVSSKGKRVPVKFACWCVAPAGHFTRRPHVCEPVGLHHTIRHECSNVQLCMQHNPQSSQRGRCMWASDSVKCASEAAARSLCSSLLSSLLHTSTCSATLRRSVLSIWGVKNTHSFSFATPFPGRACTTFRWCQVQGRKWSHRLLMNLDSQSSGINNHAQTLTEVFSACAMFYCVETDMFKSPNCTLSQ